MPNDHSPQTHRLYSDDARSPVSMRVAEPTKGRIESASTADPMRQCVSVRGPVTSLAAGLDASSQNGHASRWTDDAHRPSIRTVRDGRDAVRIQESLTVHAAGGHRNEASASARAGSVGAVRARRDLARGQRVQTRDTPSASISGGAGVWRAYISNLSQSEPQV